VGHTGTLDPFATGVLPLALGPATRLIQFLDESYKMYDATILLGSATDTGDPTGQEIRTAALPDADEARVREVLAGFVGEQMQEPHAFSAVKVDGKPLYHYARKGEKKRAAPRKITIHAMELLHYDGATLRVMISCSRGTYARVLADDVATALGSAGHLSALERPRSGPFYLEDALSMPDLAAMVAPDSGASWQDVMLSRGPKTERVPWRPRAEVVAAMEPMMKRPLDLLSHLPLADVGSTDGRRVRKGGAPPPPPVGTPMGGQFLVVAGTELVAVATKTPEGAKVLRVFGPNGGRTAART
jgi:tRNA pseudouridine(55) synthase